ncbi:MAG: 2-oxo acid dehydrogenase subunit E2 [Clostridiaceae bacterium]|nr:2-oxo acid dehydrogenase subunit E2 [Clostridiaceae bacterium]
MAVPVIMPRQGQTVESCIIAKWHKKKGDKVSAGDILFTYETDKATFDEEAKDNGILLDIFFEEGDDVPVLTNVCVIGQEGEDALIFNPHTGKGQGDAGDKTGKADEEDTGEGIKIYAKRVWTSEDDEKAGEDDGKAGKGEGEAGDDGETAFPVDGLAGDKVKISPRARNLAGKAGIDYRYARPTGPGNRIVEKDIIALMEEGPVFTRAAMDDSLKAGEKAIMPGAAEGTGIGGRITTCDLERVLEKLEKTIVAESVSHAPAPAASITSIAPPPAVQPGLDFTEMKLTTIRKTIARAMHNSLMSTAQLTLNTSFDATEILEFRKKVKQNKDKLKLQNITINGIVLFAVSRTLPGHKMLNAHFLDDRVLLFNAVHLGVAVDTERGLMVPTIFNADKKSLNEISAETKILAEECQKGSINPDLLKGGTFTVTNLGMLDIESFTPVLNPPQTGILGVSNIVTRVKEVNGQYIYYPAMGLSLTFDHRAVDGAPAARFLMDLKANLENFIILLSN